MPKAGGSPATTTFVATLIVNGAASAVRPSASVTLTWRPACSPGAVGVPESAPEVESAMPAGSWPVTRLKT